MNILYNLSIKDKLSAIILIVSVVVLGVTAVALFANERFRLHQNLHDELMTLASIMAINSGVGLAFDDEKVASDILASLKAKPRITLAHIFMVNGEYFASYFRSPELAELPTDIQTYVADRKLINTLDGEGVFEDAFFLHDDHAEVFKQVVYDGRVLGMIFIESDLEEFKQILWLYAATLLGVMLVSLVFAQLLGIRLQCILTEPLYRLLATIAEVSSEKNYQLRAKKTSNDEIGVLIDSFNEMLEQIEFRDSEIRCLNEMLQEENQRLGAELEITRQLQQMILPTPDELKHIAGLDITGFMEPANEVGGDYYDVLSSPNGVKIGIGDVTGHGLESGVLMLMVQMAVRTLLENQVENPTKFLAVLNRALFGNVKRMNIDKNLTLSLLDYHEGKLQMTGQHEEILVMRHDGRLERIDTLNLGFMVGLLPEIGNMVEHLEIFLEIGDGVVLYTDGVTEARNWAEEMYGVERLCKVITRHWHLPSAKIEQAVIRDLHNYMGEQKILDDITLLIFKRIE